MKTQCVTTSVDVSGECSQAAHLHRMLSRHLPGLGLLAAALRCPAAHFGPFTASVLIFLCEYLQGNILEITHNYIVVTIWMAEGALLVD